MIMINELILNYFLFSSLETTFLWFVNRFSSMHYRKIDKEKNADIREKLLIFNFKNRIKQNKNKWHSSLQRINHIFKSLRQLREKYWTSEETLDRPNIEQMYTLQADVRTRLLKMLTTNKLVF